MQNGFLYPIFKFIIDKLYYLNLVELFKFISKKTSRNGRVSSSLAIDIYIVLKWLLVMFLWYTFQTSFICVFIVFYLLVMNFYTYFYYHFWKDSKIATKEIFHKRFLNVVQSFSFSMLAFGFLIDVAFREYFQFGNNSTFFTAIIFSLRNSLFFYDSALIKPTNDIAHFILGLQNLNTFIFISVVVARSLYYDK
jgi:hypothetical protein